MIIRICVGSACHTRGAKEVLDKFKILTAAYEGPETIDLQSSFCLGRCTDGVSVQIDEGPVYALTPQTVDSFFVALLSGGTDHEIHHV